ncbi:Tad domain-containing protein [Erythrobacter sp. EC-HK427]|nr:Tad domain-containing protein [Erythrobacter sp. EC-HK427]
MGLVALGMPVLVGGAGLAVDVSQWYVWKREVQYAVDQAAIAGAYAYSNEDMREDYVIRAGQEFAENEAVIDGRTSEPLIGLEDYNGGTDNAISVTASVSKTLPFTGIFLSTPASVTATAWATWEGGNDPQTSCIIAVDEDADVAITLSGNTNIQSGCGVTALSISSTSIVLNGGGNDDNLNSSYTLGWILSGGGVDDGLDALDDTPITENVSGLVNPYADLVPPDNPTPRAAPCEDYNDETPDASYTNSYTVTRTTYSRYYRGDNRSSMTMRTSTQVGESATRQETLQETQAGWNREETVNTISGTETRRGSGRNAYWDRTDTVTVDNYVVTNSVDNNGGGTTTSTVGWLQPGTYQGFDIRCNVTLASGVYVIDGGLFEINAQNSITGHGVMFVLKNGAGIKINGGAEVDLLAMTQTELIAAGVNAEDAAVLEGMLIFEDPNSPGNDRNKVNGTADLLLGGIIYLPASPLEWTGNAGVSSRCLTIAAATITFSGNFTLGNLCPPGQTHTAVVTTNSNAIRLVV